MMSELHIQFEWDFEKEKINISKHKVSFAEASHVFSDIFRNRSPEALNVQIPPDCKRLPGASDARKRPAKCASAHELAADKADGVPGERLLFFS